MGTTWSYLWLALEQGSDPPKRKMRTKPFTRSTWSTTVEVLSQIQFRQDFHLSKRVSESQWPCVRSQSSHGTQPSFTISVPGLLESFSLSLSAEGNNVSAPYRWDHNTQTGSEDNFFLLFAFMLFFLREWVRVWASPLWLSDHLFSEVEGRFRFRFCFSPSSISSLSLSLFLFPFLPPSASIRSLVDSFAGSLVRSSLWFFLVRSRWPLALRSSDGRKPRTNAPLSK